LKEGDGGGSKVAVESNDGLPELFRTPVLAEKASL
jgi:hypothetical protein